MLDDDNKRPKKLLEEGYNCALQYIVENKWSEACELLSEILEVDPQYKDAKTYLRYAEGRQAFEQGDWDATIGKLREIHRFKDTQTFLNQAKRKNEAQTLYEEVLESIEGQKRRPIEDQEWNQIASALIKAEQLDPGRKEILIKKNEVRKYQEAQKRFVGVDASDKEPLLKQGWFWGAIGALIALSVGTATIYVTVVLSQNTRSNPMLTSTAIAVEGTMAAAKATETAMGIESATAAARATGAVMAAESATAAIKATETAIAVESATAAANATGMAIAVESATAAANATGTAVAAESATAAANATGTAVAAESATAAANAAGTAVAAENATDTALAVPPLASAPMLLEPPNGTTVAIPTRLDLVWTWDGTLGPEDYFRVEIWNKYNDFSDPIDVAWVKGSTYKYDKIEQAYDREYRWRITVVRGIPAGEKPWYTPECPVWEPNEKLELISEESAIWTLIAEPPPSPEPLPEPRKKPTPVR